ncbi:formylmethionine deformylase, partial [mine drainage metagenome]
MNLLEVVTLPGEILSRKASQIVEIGDQIRDLAASMVELMYSSPGCVGLAANQVGHGESLFVLDVSSHKKTTTSHGLVVMLNPELIHVSDLETMREGCMSVP